MTTTDMPLWALHEITKSFPGVRANDGICLDLRAGEIHALLGENGCGKSTLIKILSGVIQPDHGRILRQGTEVKLTSPTAARAEGIATVFQEFSLVPYLSVAENIVLGRHPRNRLGLIDWPRIIAAAQSILSDLSISIDPRTPISALSVAEQQLVEIAKAIGQDAQLLILDEPTTALGAAEIETLHGLLRRMTARGVAILYISHRLDEVLSLVDTITILRNGRVASAASETRHDLHSIVESMIGNAVSEHYPKEHNAGPETVLEARTISTGQGVKEASFTVRRGEVLGLGGVIGSGRTEIARAIFGVDRLTAGEISIGGQPVHLRHPRDAIRHGLALVPENRKFDGLFFNFTGGPNITMANIGRLIHGGLLDHRQEAKVASDFIRDLEISSLAAVKFVNLLSGGNQQKIVIARWLFSQAQVLILDEPTQGIDIGAKIAVYHLINELTRSGKSIILISSDHDELIAMSDRIALIERGRVVGIREAKDVTPKLLKSVSADHSPIAA